MEDFDTREEAVAREKWLKTGFGRKWLKREIAAGRTRQAGLVPTEAELANAENREFETGEQLLVRILTERRQDWRGRGQYKEPPAPDTAELSPVPKGWTWARLEQLGVTYGGLTKNPKRTKLAKQLPYLRVANVYANELRLDEIEYIGVADSELDKLLVRAGDLLIVEGNGSKDQIGRLAIWDGSFEPCVHQNHLIKVRPWSRGCRNGFFTGCHRRVDANSSKLWPVPLQDCSPSALKKSETCSSRYHPSPNRRGSWRKWSGG